MGPLARQATGFVVAPEDRGLRVVCQDLALWPHLTVHGNLTVVLASQHVAREQREARIKDASAPALRENADKRSP